MSSDVLHCLLSSCSSVLHCQPQVGPVSCAVQVLTRTSFYPCPYGLAPGSQYAVYAQRAQRNWRNGETQLRDGFEPSKQTVPRSNLFSSLLFLFDSIADYAAFNTAPSGISPWSRYFHSATKSLRASATIPIRRMRPLPCPNRSQNHLLKALLG